MKKTNTILYAGAAICALTALILQILCVVFGMEVGAHYFNRGASMPTVANLVAFFSFVLGAVASFTGEKSTRRSFETPSLGISSLGLLAGAVLMISKANDSKIALFAVIALLLGCAYPLLSRFMDRTGTLVVLSGFSAVIGCILLVAYYYFDKVIEMNATEKVFAELGTVTAMLYFAEDIRYSLGKELPKVSMTLGCAVIACSALSGIPMLLAYFTDKMTDSAFLAGAVISLTLAIDVVLRLFRAIREG